jgi:hypothetical protein
MGSLPHEIETGLKWWFGGLICLSQCLVASFFVVGSISVIDMTLGWGESAANEAEGTAQAHFITFTHASPR